eukprot:1353593-Pyramimonas_sp.AAC.1
MVDYLTKKRNRFVEDAREQSADAVDPLAQPGADVPAGGQRSKRSKRETVDAMDPLVTIPV